MEQGYTVSTKRIVRLMKEHGLKRKQALPENATFQRHYTYRPNLVKQILPLKSQTAFGSVTSPMLR